VNNVFYLPNHTQALVLGGAAQKAEPNLRIIRLIKELDQAQRLATPEEQELLDKKLQKSVKTILSGGLTLATSRRSDRSQWVESYSQTNPLCCGCRQ
jgi:hypothetical protein